MKKITHRSGPAAVGHFHYRRSRTAAVEVDIASYSPPFERSVFLKSFTFKVASSVARPKTSVFSRSFILGVFGFDVSVASGYCATALGIC